MRLILFEIRKIFCSKITIFTSIIVLALICSVGISDVIEWKDRIGNVSEYNNFVNSYEGKIDKNLAKEFEEELNKSNKIGSVDDESNKDLNEEETRNLDFKLEYSNAANKAATWVDSKYEDKEHPYTVTGLTKLCEKLETEGKQNTFIYKDTAKQLNLLKDAGEPGYYNNTEWSRLFSVITGVVGIVAISLVCIIVIAPIFSNERRCGMETIILSTKMGRKKIVKAKIIASIVFAITYVTLFHICNALVYLIPAKVSIFKRIPLNSIYEFTPFNITTVQAFCMSYGLEILSFGTLVTIFCFISATQKKNVSSVVCALIFAVAPLFIRDSGTVAHILTLAPSVAFNSNVLFKRYHSYNIMGTPVEYLTVAIVSLIIMFLLGIIFTIRSYNKKLR